MNIAVERLDSWTILHLEGYLDAEAGPGVYLRFQRELFRGSTRFCFDLRDVSRVDSAGLSVLVRCYKDARTRGGEVRLGQVPPSIGRILAFTRLDTIFPTLDDQFLVGDAGVRPAA